MQKRVLKVKYGMLIPLLCCFLSIIVLAGCGSDTKRVDIEETNASTAAESEALQIVSQQEEPQTESRQDVEQQEVQAVPQQEPQAQEAGAENDAQETSAEHEMQEAHVRETVEYSYEDIYLSIDLLPGWEFEIETAEELEKEDGSSLCAIEFWQKDYPDTVFSFSYETWFGICGTGVTIEEFTHENGIRGYRYTEEIEDTLWLNMTFRNPSENDEEGVYKGGTYCMMASPKLSEWDMIEAEFEEIVQSVWVGAR
ncbi:MAG: hypothetical protein NC321_12875 [Clostridium sp.]|nr:hypothetical protein [Clostridium sp.]